MRIRQPVPEYALWVGVLFLMIGWISACVPSADFEHTPPPLPSSTVTVVTPTTRLPTTVATLTKVPTIPPTITPLPTVSAEELEDYVVDLMKTNGKCRLPCWWGISPGETSMEKVHQFLEHLGVRIFEYDFKSDDRIYLVHSADLKAVETSEIYFGTSFLEAYEQLDAVSVGGSEFPPSDYFKSFWAAYTPVEIMRVYGEPSRILLMAPGMPGFGDTGNHGYQMWFEYASLGFIIRYDGIVRDLPVYRICPTFEVGSGQIFEVDIYMQSPENPVPLESSDSILTSDYMTDGSVKSIKEATGLTIQEFYNLLTQDEELPCFTSLQDIWIK